MIDAAAAGRRELTANSRAEVAWLFFYFRSGVYYIPSVVGAGDCRRGHSGHSHIAAYNHVEAS